MAEVELVNVTKSFREEGKREHFTALDNINLRIEDKQFAVLVGPSGCGKSTLLRIVAGLETASSGTVKIGGRECTSIHPKDRHIAMVFQNYALYPQMSVEENMAFGLKLAKVPKKEISQRVAEAAAILGLESFLKRLPKALSGGQRQRVALGRAIVRKPQVFLFDEPLSNLDAKMRVQMRVEISRIAAQLQTTMIYVTHDQTEAMTMGERIVCMKAGTIQQVGAPLDLYDKPANAFVAGFIGTPPINFLPCRVTGAHVTIPGTQCTFDIQPQLLNNPDRFTHQSDLIGIRPESLHVCEQGAGLSCQVEVVESLGSETLVHCRLDKHRLVARIEPKNRIKRGDFVTFRPDEAGIHFFVKDIDGVADLPQESNGHH